MVQGYYTLPEAAQYLGMSAEELKQMAQNRLGTIGSGNHYVDLFADEQDRIWIGVHFGSRGLGHKTATYFLQQGGAKDGMPGVQEQYRLA